MRLVGVALLATLAAPPPLMTALQKIDLSISGGRLLALVSAEPFLEFLI